MSEDGRRELAKHIRRMTRLSSSDRKFHDVTLSFVPSEGWGLTVMTGPAGKEEALYQRVATHCVLKKHQLGADLWIGFGILAGRKGAFHVLVVDYAPWKPDSELDSAVEELYENQPSIDQLSEKRRRALE
jgi:hypothetical protein